MVDFLFGKGITWISKAPDADRRRIIQTVINAVFEANGGAGFFQDLAVLGAVYGFADCIVRPGERLNTRLQQPSPGRSVQKEDAAASHASILSAASAIALDLVEAPRALPILEEQDYRMIRYYIQHFYQARNEAGPPIPQPPASAAAVTEISADRLARYEDGRRIAQGLNPLGYVPVVHIRTSPSRISTKASAMPNSSSASRRTERPPVRRASRITMQALNVSGQGHRGHGGQARLARRMWCTDNQQASIEEFGGDRSCPSENLHITEIETPWIKSAASPGRRGRAENKLAT